MDKIRVQQIERSIQVLPIFFPLHPLVLLMPLVDGYNYSWGKQVISIGM